MRIMLNLTEEERKALVELALRERRHPREQAALLLADGLERLGVLPGLAAKSQPRRPNGSAAA